MDEVKGDARGKRKRWTEAGIIDQDGNVSGKQRRQEEDNFDGVLDWARWCNQ